MAVPHQQPQRLQLYPQYRQAAVAVMVAVLVVMVVVVVMVVATVAVMVVATVEVMVVATVAAVSSADATITMADGTTKLISKLEVGDAVKGHNKINHVILLFLLASSDQAVYSFNGGKKFVTGGHPFYTAQGWKAIDPSLTPTEGHNVKTTALKVGDVLLLDTGKPYVVNSIEREESGAHDIFNPKMDGDHTYYANGLLVHNKFALPISSPSPTIGGGDGGGGGSTAVDISNGCNDGSIDCTDSQ